MKLPICLPKLLLFSLTAHSPIMKFMGDYPSKQAHSSVEVTDQIFVPAIQEEVLRDEIYCQIMKQLTENRNRYLIYLGTNTLLLQRQASSAGGILGAAARNPCRGFFGTAARNPCCICDAVGAGEG